MGKSKVSGKAFPHPSQSTYIFIPPSSLPIDPLSLFQSNSHSQHLFQFSFPTDPSHPIPKPTSLYPRLAPTTPVPLPLLAATTFNPSTARPRSSYKRLKSSTLAFLRLNRFAILPAPVPPSSPRSSRS